MDVRCLPAEGTKAQGPATCRALSIPSAAATAENFAICELYPRKLRALIFPAARAVAAALARRVCVEPVLVGIVGPLDLILERPVLQAIPLVLGAFPFPIERRHSGCRGEQQLTFRDHNL